MAARISGSVGSYESGAKNVKADITTVQQLLTAAAKKLSRPQFDPGGIDGLISRVASRSGTVKAITAFQKEQVRMIRPDSRIDVGGNTWGKLTSAAGTVPVKTPTPAKGLITLTVSHGGLVPTGTKRKSGEPVGTYNGAYESSFKLSGGLTGTFRGSIWPNDMTVKGHLLDGTYNLHIGFHKGGSATKQTAANLVVKTSGIRAGLLVEMRKSVSVNSDSSSKKTSSGINIHNGISSTKRSSDGCLNLPPNDWSRFMQLFIDGFPNINDWHAEYKNTGKKIGTLVIQP
ncbi:hypothetical protein CA13_38010 [Planctomycetes bacterium CA13]|uniref:YkuD domain-containing protein n=1 Tax=Novipirellula herctigrandis TaxID=2527986 RepID=A0A5C5Z4N2_9BACT|nr:hypothetical protein CA13_38010 [Planctomycetes bacterium CA13]